MAQITVKLYTTIRNKLVKGEIPLEVVNVAEALENMERHFGPEFRKEIHEADGSIKNNYIVALNGHPIGRKNPEKIRVSNNDMVHIYPAVSGG